MAMCLHCREKGEEPTRGQKERKTGRPHGLRDEKTPLIVKKFPILEKREEATGKKGKTKTAVQIGLQRESKEIKLREERKRVLTEADEEKRRKARGGGRGGVARPEGKGTASILYAQKGGRDDRLSKKKSRHRKGEALQKKYVTWPVARKGGREKGGVCVLSWERGKGRWFCRSRRNEEGRRLWSGKKKIIRALEAENTPNEKGEHRRSRSRGE